MNHQEAKLLFAELVHGRLDEGTREAFSAHQASCEECRSLTEVYALLRTATGEEAAARGEAHPSNVEIVSYSLRNGALAAETLARIAAHLRVCTSCTAEVETVRKADEATRAPLVSIWGRLLEVPRPALASALAAVIVFALLAYPAFLGTFRLPSLKEEAEGLRQAKGHAESEARELISSLDGVRAQLKRATSWKGPARWLFLGGQPRDGGRAQTLQVLPDEPYALITFEPRLPETALGSERYRVEIERPDGRIVSQSVLTASQIREHLAAYGVVTLPLPSQDLTTGRYRLTVRHEAIAEGRPVFEARFEIIL